MSGRLKLGVLISGRGSNLQALINACGQSGFPAKIVLVISNVQAAKGLERAKSANIPYVVINHNKHSSRADFDAEMTKVLSSAKVELVCLAGFMRLLSRNFVEHWYNQLINIHPSLLPAFKGLHVQAKAIEAGAKFSGCTVHFVRHQMDEGPIIAQAAVPIHQNDSPGSLSKRILEQEHRLYPSVIRWFAEDRVQFDGKRVVISGIGPLENALINPSPEL